MKLTRTYLIIILFVLICSCDNSQQRNTVEKTVDVVFKEPEFNFIGKELRGEIERKIEFGTIQSISLDINEDGKTDTILIERIMKWTSDNNEVYDWDDPGDFHRITVLISGGETKTFVNIDGWVNITTLLRYDNNFNRESIVKSNNIIVRKENDRNILVFIAGYPYASMPGLLTILNIYGGETIHMIFNDNIEFYGLKDFDGDGTKDLITTVWDGFYNDEDRNIYRHKVYLLNGSLTYSQEYSKKFSEEY